MFFENFIYEIEFKLSSVAADRTVDSEGAFSNVADASTVSGDDDNKTLADDEGVGDTLGFGAELPTNEFIDWVNADTGSGFFVQDGERFEVAIEVSI